MKKIISLSLAALMLVLLLLTATSCGMESMTGYTRLRDHITDTVGTNNVLSLDGSAVGFTEVFLIAPADKGSGQVEEIQLVADAVNQTALFRLILKMTSSTEKAEVTYQILDSTTGEEYLAAESTILLTHYTGDDLIVFNSTISIPPTYEMDYRNNATAMLNCAFKVLDEYTTKNLDMNMHELGFIALSEKYMAPTIEFEVEEDLGGAFSPVRLKKAGLMIIQGLGMVFLVLAVLWLVLLIFKKVFYKDPAATAKKAEQTTPAAPAPAPTNDDALVAAITAAVAAYIDSDPALSSQFAGGFRVVSFKKKNGKASWNH